MRTGVDVFRMIIDGRPVEASSGEWFEVRNPADITEVIGLAPKANREDVRSAIRTAVSALETSWWPDPSESRRRGKILHRYIALVNEEKDKLAELLTREQGKVYRESIAEVDGLENTFEYYAGYGGKIAGEVKYARDGDSVVKLETRRQPIGLCCAILPFNFPVTQFAWKVAPALIAGNAIIVKPASTTPLTDMRLTSLLQEAGIPSGIVSIVTGHSSVVGTELVRAPEIRRVAFTGSTETGRLVAADAAPTLKRVTLELGGSDPTVVAADADLEETAKTIVRYGRFRNCGQSCTAVKRVYVFEDVFSRFVKLVTQQARELRVGNGLRPETDMGPLNNPAQLEDLERLLGDAVMRGAEVVVGGNRMSGDEYKQGYFFEPTVVVNVPDDAAIWHEECFGPVLPMMPVHDLDEAIDRANHTPFGLGASLWSKDDKIIEQFVRRIQSGMVWINYKPLSIPEAPFGGIKASGYGRELGDEGLSEYLETKSIRKCVGRVDETR